jgi:hypothetical protein
VLDRDIADGEKKHKEDTSRRSTCRFLLILGAIDDNKSVVVAAFWTKAKAIVVVSKVAPIAQTTTLSHRTNGILAFSPFVVIIIVAVAMACR